MAQSSDLPLTTNFGFVTCCRRVLRRLIIIGVFLTAFGFGWLGVYDAYWPPSQREEAAGPTIDAVVEGIIGVESHGDPNAKNNRSSATGLGQFLDETWLDMIRAHRPDLAKGRSRDEILELRRDAKVAREITARFTQRNAEMLRKRGLPLTPRDAIFGSLCWWRGSCGDLVSHGECRHRPRYGDCRRNGSNQPRKNH
jgi:hypothetical protein